MADEKVVLISGANRGVGAAAAEAFAAGGWRVSLGMRSPVLPVWADENRHQVCGYDATDPKAGERWVAAALARFGRIDAIIANAGVMVAKTVIEAEDEDLDAMLTVNVRAPRQLARAAWEPLAAGGQGRIIIIASLSGKRVKSARSGTYSVSKFAAVGLAHALRHAGFDQGIRATAVCPGFVATDMARRLTDRDDRLMTSPDDLARIIVMLVSLPNEASVAEFAINCQLEESF
ncbi:SDR family NAD(P)-dependent oxidoreductase [Neorhizobium petrolearium]|uniref:SDR family NAD(P)-dependent oxidoreductase n=1 Tax=Neorhizobium petrolearium TaxID=515361 RepID=A0ABY8MDR8_9HYPH|nr:SDR family NAD(P)-dependent oxidoreductase [Neorhizobium petrolearium]MCC2614084.1 SDR family NAD(P)-dependent oxidoreductase [Neorhizobium petrolearium]WGI71600.1 SDR family NAD(P)-dependent oxidoreductase [Neorhizobium petrolearium]